MDPDLLGGDTDPINYCISLINSYRVKIGSWLLRMLCVLLVWWVGDHGSAVGWSFRFCLCVPILFRFTSKKFVYLIKKHKRRYVWALCIQIKIFRNFEFGVTTCLLQCLSIATASVFVSANPGPPPPPHCLCREGGGCCSNLIRYV